MSVGSEMSALYFSTSLWEESRSESKLLGDNTDGLLDE